MAVKLPLKWNDAKSTITEFEPGDKINVNSLPSLSEWPDFSLAVARATTAKLQRTHSDMSPLIWSPLTGFIQEVEKWVIIKIAANTEGDVTLFSQGDTVSKVLSAIPDGGTVKFCFDNTLNSNAIRLIFPQQWVTQSRRDAVPVILQSKIEGGSLIKPCFANQIVIWSITRIASATNQYALIQSSIPFA